MSTLIYTFSFIGLGTLASVCCLQNKEDTHTNEHPLPVNAPYAVLLSVVSYRDGCLYTHPLPVRRVQYYLVCILQGGVPLHTPPPCKMRHIYTVCILQPRALLEWM